MCGGAKKIKPIVHRNDCRGEVKEKSSLPPLAEELIAKTVRGQERAHQDGGIKNNVRKHAVF
jgi:hypothetical protein